MIKVCHLTSAHKSNDIRIFIKECSSLAEAGFDVSLVCAGAKSEIVNNVKIIGSDFVAKGRLHRMTSGVWNVYKIAAELKSDIYHFHDPELMMAAYLLKLKGAKVIYDVHEDLPKQILDKYWINKYFRKATSTIIETIESFFSKRFNGVITATPFIERKFKRVNPNTIAVNNYPLLNELSGSFDWNNKTNSVCYVGGITKIRCINEMVDAIEMTEKITLNIAGNFSPENLKPEIEALAGWKKVKYFGTVGRKEVAKIVNEAFAGLVIFYPLGNHIDAQPNKMFEYMSAGIPIICSDFELWKELIHDNKCGITVNPFDTKAIANAITYLNNNRTEAEQLGMNGRNAVVEKYNWEQEKLKLIAFYKNLN